VTMTVHRRFLGWPYPRAVALELQSLPCREGRCGDCRGSFAQDGWAISVCWHRCHDVHEAACPFPGCAWTSGKQRFESSAEHEYVVHVIACHGPLAAA